ncbi:MAG: methyl-accepting chemotaxis protein [Firmicutes bacterium]|nr:methyl-accepting chemotaxis protein [Bacillota bacterium]
MKLAKLRPYFSGVFAKILIILIVLSIMIVAVGLVGNSGIEEMNQAAANIFNSNTSVLFPLFDFLVTVYRTEYSAYEILELNTSGSITAFNRNLTECVGLIGNFLYNLPDETRESLEQIWAEYEEVAREFNNELRSGENDLAPLYYRFKEESRKLYNFCYELGKAQRIVGVDSFRTGRQVYSSTRTLQMIITIVGVTLGLLIGFLVSRSIIRPLHKLRDSTRLLAQGDLNTRVDLSSRDEVGVVASAFNHAVQELRSMVTRTTREAKKINASTHNLFRVVDETTTSLGELNKLIDHLAAGAKSQSQSVNSAIDTIQQVTSRMNLVVRATQESNKICQEASNDAQNGRKATEELIQAIDNFIFSVRQIKEVVSGLVEDSRQIQVLVDIIRDIAEKSTLLSLNASIEAARAGEHGRGFAVVATNIGLLAQRSREAVDHINEVIELILRKNQQVVYTVDESNAEIEQGRNQLTRNIALFKELMGKVETIARNISQITQVASQVGKDNENVITKIEQVYQISQNNLTAMEEVSATFQQQYSSTIVIKESAHQLDELANELTLATDKFIL